MVILNILKLVYFVVFLCNIFAQSFVGYACESEDC